MAERLQIVVDVDGAGRATAEIKKVAAAETGLKSETAKLGRETHKLDGAWRDANGRIRNARGLMLGLTAAEKASVTATRAETRAVDAQTRARGRANVALRQSLSGANRQSAAMMISSNRMTAAGIAVGALGLGLVKASVTGAKFEYQMDRVGAVSGATGGQMKKLEGLAMSLGAKTQFSAKEAADGMYQLATAGFSVNEVMGAIPGTLDLAAASGTDLASAAAIQSTALRGFGLDAKDAGRVADVLAQTVNSSAVEMADLGESMSYIAPVAKASGQSMEDMMAAVAIMGNVSIKGSQAGTTLRTAMVRLTAPTKKSKNALDELGISAKELRGPKGLLPLPEIMKKIAMGAGKVDKGTRNAALAAIFGREALSGMIEMVEKGPAAFDKQINALKNSDGVARETAKKMRDNVAGAWDNFTGSVETAAIALSARWAPALQNALNWGAKTVNSLSNLTNAFGKSGTAMAIVGGIVGLLAGKLATLAIMAIAGQIMEMAASIRMAGGAMAVFNVIAAANPLGLVAMSIGLVVGAMTGFRVSQMQTKITADAVTASVTRQTDALRALRDQNLNSKDAHLSVKKAQLSVKQAVEQRTQAEKQNGKSSTQWRQANLDVKQAVIDRTRAQRHANDVDKDAKTVASEAAASANARTETSGKRVAQLSEEIGKTKDAIKWLRAHGASEKELGPLLAELRRKQRAHTTALGEYKDATRSARSANKKLGGSFSDMQRTVSDSIAMMNDQVNATLKKYGFSPVALSLRPGDASTTVNVDKDGNADTVVVKAGGGYLQGSGLRDTVPVMAAPGEAVVNRHQQGPINAALQSTFGIGLPDLFRKVNRPHYMAGGGYVAGANISGPAGAITNMARGSARAVERAAEKYAAGKVADMGSAGGGSIQGLTALVRRAIQFAKSHGWSGSVTSGFRTYAQQAQLYALYKAGRGNLAAPPGSSNHEGGEAIDVSDTEGFARAMAMAPANARLFRRIPGEPWHFSKTGFAKGGFIRGKASVFGPPLEGAGTTAYGYSSGQPGIAVNPTGTPSGWNSAEAGKWARKMVAVTLDGHKAMLRVIDKGPNANGRKIDITGAGAKKMGINPADFPTNAIGTVAMDAAKNKAKGQKPSRRTKKIKRFKTGVSAIEAVEATIADLDTQYSLTERSFGDEIDPAETDELVAIKEKIAAQLRAIWDKENKTGLLAKAVETRDKAIAKRKKEVNALIAERNDVVATLHRKLSKKAREKARGRLERINSRIGNLVSDGNELAGQREALLGKRKDINYQRWGVDMDIAELRGEKTTAAPDTTTSDMIIKQQREIIGAQNIAYAQKGVFGDFSKYIGAFKQGGPVNETGMALVHKGEWVVPEGGARVAQASAPNIVINLNGDMSNVSGSVEIDGRTVRTIDRVQGRTARRIGVAPGRA